MQLLLLHVLLLLLIMCARVRVCMSVRVCLLHYPHFYYVCLCWCDTLYAYQGGHSVVDQRIFNLCLYEHFYFLFFIFIYLFLASKGLGNGKKISGSLSLILLISVLFSLLSFGRSPFLVGASGDYLLF